MTSQNYGSAQWAAHVAKQQEAARRHNELLQRQEQNRATQTRDS